MTNRDQPSADRPQVVEYWIDDSETVIEAVLSAVSVLTNTRVESTPDEEGGASGDREPVPPLYECVDPDALAGLVTDASADADVTVTFPYAECTVTVAGTGVVRVCEQSSPTDAGR